MQGASTRPGRAWECVQHAGRARTQGPAAGPAPWELQFPRPSWGAPSHPSSAMSPKNVPGLRLRRRDREARPSPPPTLQPREAGGPACAGGLTLTPSVRPAQLRCPHPRWRQRRQKGRGVTRGRGQRRGRGTRGGALGRAGGPGRGRSLVAAAAAAAGPRGLAGSGPSGAMSVDKAELCGPLLTWVGRGAGPGQVCLTLLLRGGGSPKPWPREGGSAWRSKGSWGRLEPVGFRLGPRPRHVV